MARQPSNLRRIQGYLSARDAHWWDSVCGPELFNMFRDQSALADVVLPAHLSYLSHLAHEGVKPEPLEVEPFKRIALSIRSEYNDYVHSFIGKDSRAMYLDNTQFLADFTLTARNVHSAIRLAVQEAGNERLEWRMEAVQPGWIERIEKLRDAVQKRREEQQQSP